MELDCIYCVREIDNSGLEGFRCHNEEHLKKEGTSWCRPMNVCKSYCKECEYYISTSSHEAADIIKKQKLLALLSKEDIHTISLAYMYAKNMTQYGVDVTKEWDTAIRQTVALDQARKFGFCEGMKYASEGRDKREVQNE